MIRHFDGCPNWAIARDRLIEAMAEVGLDPAAIEFERVETDEEARRLEFRGSPTVLVDGTDPFAPSDAPVGLSCRMYHTEADLEGSPSVAQLVEALRP